eukprot:COSAG02_NODE_2784_length_8036_cov_15.324808_5_plen_64_part_00
MILVYSLSHNLGTAAVYQKLGHSAWRAIQGWIRWHVGSRENSLITAVQPSDHLESLLFVTHYS